MRVSATNLFKLRHHLGALAIGGAALFERLVLSDPVLDASLPWGGLPRGSIHQLEGVPGDTSVLSFAAGLTSRCAGPDGRALWLRLRRDRQETGEPYGPGLARYSLPPDRLMLVEARAIPDLLWALEEGLRCTGFSVALAEGISPDLTASRRLQLAAEASGVTALLVSPGPVRTRSVALTRWRVTAAPSARGVHRPRWQVELLHCRGGKPGSWIMEWDDAALGFAVVPALASRALAQAV